MSAINMYKISMSSYANSYVQAFHVSPLQWCHVSPWLFDFWPSLIWSLNAYIFWSVTPFDGSFATLEILWRALRDHAIFSIFWDIWIFSLSLSVEAIMSILICLWEFWVVLSLLWILFDLVHHKELPLICHYHKRWYYKILSHIKESLILKHKWPNAHTPRGSILHLTSPTQGTWPITASYSHHWRKNPLT